MPLPDSSDKSRSIEDDNHVSLPWNPALGDTVEQVASTMQDTRKKEDPTRKLRELSKNPKNLDTNWEVEGSYFEKIEMSNIWEDDERLNIDSKKMSELENADLVLVYRDNDSNSRISKALESLVKTKYWWKVYCISIDRHIDHLNDSEKEKFRRILNTCPCLTDHTISEWTWIKTKKFEHELPSDMKNLLDDIKSIETSCMEKK